MSYEFYISPTEYDTAAQNGISYGALNFRIRNMGWPKLKAITEPIQIRHQWGKWLKVAQSNGIPNSTFHSRVKKYGWDIEKASTTPPMQSKDVVKKMTEVKRKYPKHFEITALANGISYQTFGDRVRRGMSMEEASTVPIMTKSPTRCGFKPISFGRKWHET